MYVKRARGDVWLFSDPSNFESTKLYCIVVVVVVVVIVIIMLLLFCDYMKTKNNNLYVLHFTELPKQ